MILNLRVRLAQLAALDDRATQLVALEVLGELGGPEQAAPVRELPAARRRPMFSPPW